MINHKYFYSNSLLQFMFFLNKKTQFIKALKVIYRLATFLQQSQYRRLSLSVCDVISKGTSSLKQRKLRKQPGRRKQIDAMHGNRNVLSAIVTLLSLGNFQVSCRLILASISAVNIFLDKIEYNYLYNQLDLGFYFFDIHKCKTFFFYHLNRQMSLDRDILL